MISEGEHQPGRSLETIHRLTENERAWIEFLRLLSRDSDPPVTLKAVQALRAALGLQRC